MLRVFAVKKEFYWRINETSFIGYRFRTHNGDILRSRSSGPNRNAYVYSHAPCQPPPSFQPQLPRPCQRFRRRPIRTSHWSIDYLRSRTYGGGQIEFLEVMEQNLYFTRYLIRYPSDGLNIYGFADIPNDEELHPVIIALHGYIDPAIYNTLDYTTHYADALASAGYIVLHPNLRGYTPSDDGENLFRVGMAIDVLNLIALVQSQSGRSGPAENGQPGSHRVVGAQHGRRHHHACPDGHR